MRNIVKPFHLHIKTNPVYEKTKIWRVLVLWWLILQILHILVTTEHLTNPDFKQKVACSLRIGLCTKVLYQLVKSRFVEVSEDTVEGLDAVRVFDNTWINAQISKDIGAKILHWFYLMMEKLLQPTPRCDNNMAQWRQYYSLSLFPTWNTIVHSVLAKVACFLSIRTNSLSLQITGRQMICMIDFLCAALSLTNTATSSFFLMRWATPIWYLFPSWRRTFQSPSHPLRQRDTQRSRKSCRILKNWGPFI